MELMESLHTLGEIVLHKVCFSFFMMSALRCVAGIWLSSFIATAPFIASYVLMT